MITIANEHDALTAAHAVRVEARTNLEAAAARASAARRTVADTQAEVARRSTEEAEWISRQSIKLDKWTEGGCHGVRPEVVADSKAMLALHSARANAAAAAASLQRFEAAEQAARAELSQADRAVESAADAVLNAQARALMGEIAQCEAEIVRLGEELRAFVPNQLIERVRPLESMPQIMDVLARIHGGEADDLMRPVNELQGMPRWTSKLGAMRRELIEGEGVAQTPAPSEAAA
jgi:hypothetical protein